MSDLRKNFWTEILKLAKKDKKIIVLTGDLGYSFCEKFQKALPKQFINCGASEQNIVSMAAGMAIKGYKPYCYSGLIFLLMRAYEQVRDDVCFNKRDVKIMGTGAAGFLGFTHNLVGTENEEDLLKNLPFNRFYPKTNKELKEALTSKGAAFIRL